MNIENLLETVTEDLYEITSLHENVTDSAFIMGRLHGKLGFPQVPEEQIEQIFGPNGSFLYSRGYDHGFMERKTARTTNEQFGGLPEDETCSSPKKKTPKEESWKKGLDELSTDTLKSYVDKAEVSKKDHLDANMKAKRPEVQQFHNRLVYKRHDMQQKAIKKIKG